MASTEQKQNGATLLEGAWVAAEIKAEVAAEVRLWRERYGLAPGLAVVRVGEDAASAVYVRNKVKTSEELGLYSEHHALAADSTTEQVLELVAALNHREEIDGILVQLPLPAQIDAEKVLEAIDPAKDVDGFHPVNVGRLALGQPTLAPCTPKGVMELLARYKIPVRGAWACVVGRSNIVGRPMAQLLLQADATVTIAHSRTQDLPGVTGQADILVAAIGRPAFIRREHIKPGAVVIDVGINKVSDINEAAALFGDDAEKRRRTIEKRGFTLVGDAHPAEAAQVAGYLTPVPGGVGLLTVAMLMKNTLEAAKMRRGR